MFRNENRTNCNEKKISSYFTYYVFIFGKRHRSHFFQIRCAFFSFVCKTWFNPKFDSFSFFVNVKTKTITDEKKIRFENRARHSTQFILLLYINIFRCISEGFPIHLQIKTNKYRSKLIIPITNTMRMCWFLFLYFQIKFFILIYMFGMLWFNPAASSVRTVTVSAFVYFNQLHAILVLHTNEHTHNP